MPQGLIGEAIMLYQGAVLGENVSEDLLHGRCYEHECLRWICPQHNARLSSILFHLRTPREEFIGLGPSSSYDTTPLYAQLLRSETFSLVLPANQLPS